MILWEAIDFRINTPHPSLPREREVLDGSTPLLRRKDIKRPSEPRVPIFSLLSRVSVLYCVYILLFSTYQDRNSARVCLFLSYPVCEQKNLLCKCNTSSIINTTMGDSMIKTQQPQSQKPSIFDLADDYAAKVNCRLEENRLKSFALWPLRHINLRRLSAVGFYYLGNRVICCFECQLIVQNWEENNDPWTYHMRYVQNCKFMRGIPCGNVPLNTNDLVLPLDNDEVEDEIQRRPVTHEEEGYDVCGPYDMSQIRKKLEDRQFNANVAIALDDEADIRRLPVTHESGYDSTISKFVPSYDTTKVNFRLEENRLKSFALWPLRYINSKRLSAAGFYYLGKEDIVRCFECQVIVYDWEENDDPWTDHVRHSPRCRFVRDVPCGNVPLHANDLLMTLDNEAKNKIQRQPVTNQEEEEGYDVCGPFDMSQIGKNFEDHKCDSIVKVIFDPNEQPVEISLRELREAKHPRYADRTTRLATFNSWPLVGTQSKERLAQAGFYFTGSDDLTICYYCGIQLRNWTPGDEPLRKHARLSAGCNYIARISAQGIHSSLVCVH